MTEFLNKEYDVAIAFTHTEGPREMAAGSVEFVLWGVTAKKKFDFIHADVEKENLLIKSNIKKFAKFDKLFCVSKSCCDQITSNCSELKEVADFLYNTQRNDLILEKSIISEKLYKNEFNIVMVSRLEKEKAHMRFLPIVKRLYDEGFNFTLNIVGDGSQKGEIETYIKHNNMDNYVIMHGYQNNPFPYIKQANLFALLSYYESFGLVLIESMLLNTPVLTTKTCSADEVVGDLGFVCENTEEGIYNCLKKILKNKNLVKEKKDALKNYDYNNDQIIGKLLKEI